MNNKCSLCGERCSFKTYQAKEMMIGLREEFTYTECSYCGALQLSNPPADWSQYYPQDYYSMRRPKKDIGLKKVLVNALLKQALGKGDTVGALFQTILGQRWTRFLNPRLVALAKVQSKWHELTFTSSVLDIGSGKGGSFLQPLAELGYTHIRGLDAHLTEPYQGSGYRVDAIDFLHSSDTQTYDVVTMHHVLEHIAEQDATFKKLHDILNPRGVAIIRIPVKSDTIWEQYGTDWVELDAPRHQVIHTPLSLERVAQRAGLEVVHSYYDSSDFQFIASERYKRDIPLHDPEAEQKFPISQAQRKEYQRMAESLNAREQGGRAVFYLTHKNRND